MIGLALGIPKMGKTQALLDYVGAHCAQNRFFVVDRANDWAADAGRWRGIRWQRWEGDWQRHPSGPPWAEPKQRGPWFADAPPPSESVDDWLFSLPPTGVFRFGWPWEGEQVAQLAVDVGGVTYVDDEIDLVATHGGWQDNPLRDVCHRGRHLPNRTGVVSEVHLLGAARRAQSLATDVTSLADWVWVFRVQGSRTWKRLIEDRILGEDEVERIATLEPYHYKLWEASGGESWGTLKPL